MLVRLRTLKKAPKATAKRTITAFIKAIFVVSFVLEGLSSFLHLPGLFGCMKVSNIGTAPGAFIRAADRKTSDTLFLAKRGKSVNQPLERSSRYMINTQVKTLEK